MAAGLAVGGCLTWNVSNVGAVADPLADAYGVAGGLILFVSVVTRPAGGLLAHRGQKRMLAAVAVVGVATGAALLSLGGSLGLSAVGALVLGLAAGIPFAAIFAAAQRARPDAPAAAVALVNSCAILTILVGTPLAGLAFAFRLSADRASQGSLVAR